MSFTYEKEFSYNPRNDNNTAILEHLHQSAKCNGNLDNFEIIGKADIDFFSTNLCLLRSVIPL